MKKYQLNNLNQPQTESNSEKPFLALIFISSHSTTSKHLFIILSFHISCLSLVSLFTWATAASIFSAVRLLWSQWETNEWGPRGGPHRLCRTSLTLCLRITRTRRTRQSLSHAKTASGLPWQPVEGFTLPLDCVESGGMKPRVSEASLESTTLCHAASHHNKGTNLKTQILFFFIYLNSSMKHFLSSNTFYV